MFDDWIKSRYAHFGAIFGDLAATYLSDLYEDACCFEVYTGGRMFRLWITEEEYTKNTSEQRDKLWLCRLNNLKRDIQNCVEDCNNAVKALEKENENE